MGKGREGVFAMGARSVYRKVLCALAAVVVVCAVSLVWGNSQAYAAPRRTPVAYVGTRWGVATKTFYNLQSALDAVKEGQTVWLYKDIETTQGYDINRGVSFALDLNSHTITSTSEEIGASIFRMDRVVSETLYAM